MSELLKRRLFFVVICCLIQSWAAQTLDYCDTDLCPGTSHVACKNEGHFGKRCTADAEIIPIDYKLRKLIVRKHNELRNYVASGWQQGFNPAKRMATMQWDNELAQLAIFNVKQCAMKHDECHNTAVFHNSGQNIAFKIWSGMTIKVKEVVVESIQHWYDGHKKATMSDIKNLEMSERFKDFSSFTVMMQEKNIRVGCAILRQNKKKNTYQYMTCNYAYTNIEGQPVYRQGSTASECTTGINEKFIGLCSTKERYRVNDTSF